MKPSVSLALVTVVRVFVPGFFALLLSTFVLEALAGKDSALAWSRLVEQGFSSTEGLVFGVAAFVLGLIVSLLDDAIYRVFEGVSMWPRWLGDLLTKHLNERVQGLYERAERVKFVDEDLYKRLWAKLRQFPLDPEGRPYAAYPTRLGNILSAYETYPDTRYDMDGVFYFYRLWAIVPKDTRDEVKAVEGNSEAPLYVSFVAALFSAAYAILSIMAIAQSAGLVSFLRWADVSAFLTLTAACLLLAIGAYYMSLPLHRIRGEHFKALFDVFKGELASKVTIPWNRSAPFKGEPDWKDKWAYLQYRKVACPSCGVGFPETLKECPRCGSAAGYEQKVREYDEEVRRWRDSK